MIEQRILYLAGPMSGIPQCNFPAFDQAAVRLRAQGYNVVSPAELDSPKERAAALASKDGRIPPDAEATWGVLLARDLRIIADEGVQAIVVLPGWEKSKGARLETFVGRLLGLPILAYPSLNPIEQYHLERVHSLYVSPEGANLSPGEVVNWSGRQPVDTAESVQADREIEPLHECGIEPTEVRVTDPETGGQKGSKLAVLGDIDPLGLMELAKVAGFGRKKYERLNYTKGFDYSLAYDACQRHLLAFWNREDVDEESKLHHLAHAAWQCLCLLCFVLRKRGNDDRMN